MRRLRGKSLMLVALDSAGCTVEFCAHSHSLSLFRPCIHIRKGKTHVRMMHACVDRELTQRHVCTHMRDMSVYLFVHESSQSSVVLFFAIPSIYILLAPFTLPQGPLASETARTDMTFTQLATRCRHARCFLQLNLKPD